MPSELVIRIPGLLALTMTVPGERITLAAIDRAIAYLQEVAKDADGEEPASTSDAVTPEDR